MKTSGFALVFQHFFKPPDGNIPQYSPLVFKFKLIFVRELVLFEKWHQEASHTLNVCREVVKTLGFALGFQHFFKPPDGNIPQYSPLVFKFKLIFARELALFEKLYQEASHTLNICREVLKTSGLALCFLHFFKPPDGNIPEYYQSIGWPWALCQNDRVVFPLATFSMAWRHAPFLQRHAPSSQCHALILNLHNIIMPYILLKKNMKI